MTSSRMTSFPNASFPAMPEDSNALKAVVPWPSGRSSLHCRKQGLFLLAVSVDFQLCLLLGTVQKLLNRFYELHRL